jgi:hydrogenase maturation protease
MNPSRRQREPGPIVVIGVGNPYRRDDGVGHRVVEALAREAEATTPAPHRPGRLHAARLTVTDGEPARLIELWRGAEIAVVVDAVVTGSQPGRLKVWDAATQTLPDRSTTSSHAAGLGEACALGAALDALPGRLLVVGIEAACTDDGTDLSPAVARAVPTAVRLVKAALATTGTHPSSHVPSTGFVLPTPTTPTTRTGAST